VPGSCHDLRYSRSITDYSDDGGPASLLSVRTWMYPASAMYRAFPRSLSSHYAHGDALRAYTVNSGLDVRIILYCLEESLHVSIVRYHVVSGDCAAGCDPVLHKPEEIDVVRLPRIDKDEIEFTFDLRYLLEGVVDSRIDYSIQPGFSEIRLRLAGRHWTFRSPGPACIHSE